MSSSSFKYREFFNGDTVMVIVPHEDDEINKRRLEGYIGVCYKWRFSV